MSEVVIFLPGIMGSELWNGGQMIWPGAVSELLFPYDKMKQLLDPNTTVGDIIRSVSLSSQYDSLIDAFATCGFREGDQPPTLAVCPYDWRKDNALAAEVLAAKVIECMASMDPTWCLTWWRTRWVAWSAGISLSRGSSLKSTAQALPMSGDW